MIYNTNNGKNFDEKVKSWIVVVLLISFLFINIAVFTIPSASDNKLAFHLLGVVDFCMGALVNFYWGSSKGSRDKDKHIQKQDEVDPDRI